ncbi:hypothetical protein AB0H49_34235 [Nocardia sp. NPDC050713]|uniref:hypothetical protein n=1 Tax=Nocardia sp. NPDC050713 TaxID=3154511 RepID=UPI0033F752A8
MAAFAFARPGLIAMVVFVVLFVIPATLLLTVDRQPSAEIMRTPARPDGCVMFCPEPIAGEGDR